MIVVTWHEFGKPPRVIEFAESKDPFEILQRCITRIDSFESPAPQELPAVSSASRQATGEDAALPNKAGQRTAGPVRDSAQQPARAGVRDASMIAYRSLEWTGRMTKQQRLVMDFFAINAQRDYTRQELANALGLGINVICGRVNELLKSPFTLLEECGRRQCRITGESANAIRARLAQRRAA